MNKIFSKKAPSPKTPRKSPLRMVSRNLKRAEIVDFLQRGFPQYTWSLRALDRKMKNFDIKCVEYGINVAEDRDPFSAQRDAPAQLLGCRAMHKESGSGLNLNYEN